MGLLRKALIVATFLLNLSYANQFDYLLFSHIISDVESGLELKADVNGRIKGITPLYQAVATNNIEIAYILVVMGADVNAMVNGETPLHKAAQIKNPLMVELLLTAGAKAQTQDEKNGNTPLHYAAYNSDLQSIKLLTQHKGDIYAKNFQGQTPAEIITAEVVIPPIILEDNNLAVSASAFKLGYGQVVFNVRNLTNAPLTIFSIGLYINGQVAGFQNQPLVIPPSTTITNATTLSITSPLTYIFKSDKEGMLDVKAGFNIDYQAEGYREQLFNSTQMKLRLWSKPNNGAKENKGENKQ